MNRLDELTLKFADATLTDDEAAEMLALIEQDDEARDRHQRLLEVEFALREDMSLDALRHRVMSAIDDDHRAVFTERTMSQIRTMPPPRRPRRTTVSLAPFLAIAASLALVAVIAYFLTTAAPSAEPTGAWVTAQDGAVYLHQGETKVQVTGKAAIPVGAVIEVQSGNAIVGYNSESTRLQLTAGTELVAQSAHSGKRFLLTHGSVQASVAPQPSGKPLLIATPTTVTTVIGTQFKLSYVAEKTALTVTEGAVELLTDIGVKTVVDAGRMAEYRPGQTLLEQWINEPRGLVSRWTFDAADERRLANLASGPNAVAAHMPSLIGGVHGSALLIDEQQYLEIPHSEIFELPSGSISFWFQANKPSQGINQMLFSKRKRTEVINGAAGFIYIAVNEDGHLRAQMYDRSGQEASIDGPESVQAGKWHHALLNFGPTGMQLYLDGKLQGEHAHDGGLAYPSAGVVNREPILLGLDGYFAKRKPLRNHFLGAIDDVRLYDRPLTAGEVAQLASGR